MIERDTIKFDPAVSQKELEKILTGIEPKINEALLHKMKARIEIVGDFEDLKKIAEMLKEMKQIG